MSRTEKEKETRKAYKEKIEELRVDLYPTDGDIKEHLKTVGAKATYIKRLIREDIKRGGNEQD